MSFGSVFIALHCTSSCTKALLFVICTREKSYAIRVAAMRRIRAIYREHIGDQGLVTVAFRAIVLVCNLFVFHIHLAATVLLLAAGEPYPQTCQSVPRWCVARPGW